MAFEISSQLLDLYMDSLFLTSTNMFCGFYDFVLQLVF